MSNSFWHVIRTFFHKKPVDYDKRSALISEELENKLCPDCGGGLEWVNYNVQRCRCGREEKKTDVL